jgi:hypothetical protein
MPLCDMRLCVLKIQHILMLLVLCAQFGTVVVMRYALCARFGTIVVMRYALCAGFGTIVIMRYVLCGVRITTYYAPYAPSFFGRI